MATDFGFEPTSLDSGYYFISYNTEDHDRIAAICGHLNDAGLPLWYDADLKYGEAWNTKIMNRISKCSEFVFFLTRGIIEKANRRLAGLDPESRAYNDILSEIYVWKEYQAAKLEDKNRLIVYMDKIRYADVPVGFRSTWLEDFQGPTQLQGVSAYNLSSPEEIARAILKELERKAAADLTPAAQPTVGNLLKRASMFLADGNWKKADEYAERVLDIDAENGEAYFIKAMADLRVKTSKELLGAVGFVENANARKALQFGSDKLKAAINDTIEASRAAEQTQKVEDKRRKAEEERQHRAEDRKTVFFGRYPQTGKAEYEPVEWLVLKREKGRALLLSKYALICQPYDNTTRQKVTWGTCSLRKWLNGPFLKAAFNEGEQKRIHLTTITSEQKTSLHSSAGATNDRVFLLSIEEANQYFRSDKARMCVPTEYALARGTRTSDKDRRDDRATCWWWLRLTGGLTDCAPSVSSDGTVLTYGNYVYRKHEAVRPALWVSLDE